MAKLSIMFPTMTKWTLADLPGGRTIHFIVNQYSDQTSITFFDEWSTRIKIPVGVILEDIQEYEILPETEYMFILLGNKDYRLCVDGEPVVDFTDFYDGGPADLQLLHSVRLTL